MNGVATPPAGGPQSNQEIDRTAQKQRRRIKTRRRSRKLNRRNGLPEYGCERVAHTVQQHHPGEKVSQRTQPARILKRKRRQQQQGGIYNDKPDQPLTKSESGHRKPGVLCAKRKHGRIVDAQKTGQRLVCHVRAKRHAQKNPGQPKMALSGGFSLARHAPDSTAV
jgi:hypothetical protein